VNPQEIDLLTQYVTFLIKADLLSGGQVHAEIFRDECQADPTKKVISAKMFKKLQSLSLKNREVS